MGNKIYVGNLSFSVDSNQLTEIFSDCGTVATSKVIMDRDTGRSRGFAFVEMSTPSEAQAAIQKLNGQDLGGRAMNISEAKPPEPRRSGSEFNSRRSY